MKMDEKSLLFCSICPSHCFELLIPFSGGEMPKALGHALGGDHHVALINVLRNQKLIGLDYLT